MLALSSPAAGYGGASAQRANARIVDFAEPFYGRDLDRLYGGHIVDGRRANNDRRTRSPSAQIAR